jgi:acyl-coenzyme A synthetase/AMP-(fatty) acid ligase
MSAASTWSTRAGSPRVFKLISHPAVLEAAVVGQEDRDGLIKPLACVVLEQAITPAPGLEEQLEQHVKALLAPHEPGQAPLVIALIARDVM